MAESPLFLIAVSGILGAIASKDLHGAPGTDWSAASAKTSETVREMDSVIQSASFVVGKIACEVRCCLEELFKAVRDGRPIQCSCCCVTDPQCVDSVKRGGDHLLRGAKSAIEAAMEGSKVAATRLLIGAEGARESAARNLPAVQQSVSAITGSLSSGYGGGAASSYSAPSYSSYSAPPPSGGGFLW